MRRLFWITVGAGLGAWSLHKAQAKARRVASDMTPRNLALRAGNRAALFARDVREGMAEREAELREAIALDAGTDAGTDVATAPPRRVLQAKYMIIDDDKDGQ